MIYAQEQANAFINESIKLDKKMSLNDFMTNFLKRFYPDANFDFKDQFLEWAKFENANQFVVTHDKLFEYGITADAQSQSAKKRIEALELLEDVDYRLRKFSEPVKQGGFVTKNQYLFTPKAFKLMLMSATKHKNHTVDVSIYRKYYLVLEEAVAYYRVFQFEVADRERKFQEQKFRFANSQLYSSGCKIDRLEKNLAARDELHKRELAATLKQFQEEANKQRAEILQETKAARDDISDLHDTVEQR